MTEMNENEQLYWTFEEVSEHPAIEEMVSRYIAKHREKMRKAFYFTFYKHMAAWLQERIVSDFGLDNLVKVTWDGLEECFHVHFINGD